MIGVAVVISEFVVMDSKSATLKLVAAFANESDRVDRATNPVSNLCQVIQR